MGVKRLNLVISVTVMVAQSGDLEIYGWGTIGHIVRI